MPVLSSSIPAAEPHSSRSTSICSGDTLPQSRAETERESVAVDARLSVQPWTISTRTVLPDSWAWPELMLPHPTSPLPTRPCPSVFHPQTSRSSSSALAQFPYSHTPFYVDMLQLPAIPHDRGSEVPVSKLLLSASLCLRNQISTKHLCSRFVLLQRADR